MTDDHQPTAQLTVYTDENGVIFFACDWEDNDNALEFMSQIFYQLDRENLITEILHDLRAQCVLEGKEESFEKMLSKINESISLEESIDDKGDNVAISPRNVTKL